MAGVCRAGIVGVTGYTGQELVRLLSFHGGFELVRVTSRRERGRLLSDIFPGIYGLRYGNLAISGIDISDLCTSCDVVFLAVPHGSSMELAPELLSGGVKVVDLSADFRLKDGAVYEDWYGIEHSSQDLLCESVFGLPELYAEEISQARLVANPGCYPTSAILGLYPALESKIIGTENIVIDSKSGTSGAGRTAKAGTLFCEVADDFKAYGLGSHRHTPEIEQELSRISGVPLQVSFNPHLLPVNRGILSTMYTHISAADISLGSVFEIYADFYKDKPWVRVLKEGLLPRTSHVRGTMFCDIGLVADSRTGRLLVVSAIDNICRGASGQALANANLMCGFEILTGLEMAPLLP